MSDGLAKQVFEKSLKSSGVTSSTVSVVISAFNRPDFLQASIGSVLEQSHPVNEIIVIDDGSTVDLKSIVTSFDDARMVYERLPENRGANAARNRGVSMASGDWVAFLDDDDCWLPNKLERQFACLQELVYSPCIASVCSYRFLETGENRKWGRTGKVEMAQLKKGNPYGGMSGLVVQREVIEALKFDESLPCGQDWDIYVRLSQHGAMIYVAESLLLYRRGSHESLTLKARKLKIEGLDHRLSSIKKHREWLGERYFRHRLADQILAYVWQKPAPLVWLKLSIERAGMLPTLIVIVQRFWRRVFPRFKDGVFS